MGMVVLWIIIAIAVATTTTILLRLRGVRRGWAMMSQKKIVRVHPFRSQPAVGLSDEERQGYAALGIAT